MRTREFIKSVKELGYKVDENKGKNTLRIECDSLENHPRHVGVILQDEEYSFDLNTTRFNLLSLKRKKELFDLIVEYSSTPIEDRKEEKKYKIKHKFLKTSNGKEAYCWKSLSGNFIDSDRASDIYTGAYTQKEIEEIKEKYNVSLDDFEFIEIKEG